MVSLSPCDSIFRADYCSGLEMYEEQNKAALAIIDRLGGGENKATWVELDRVHLEFVAEKQ